MVILGPTIDTSEVEGSEFHVDPVDDMDQFNLVGTEFYKEKADNHHVTVRRWFLVDLEKLDTGGYDVSVDVYDQQFVSPHLPSSAGPPMNTNSTELEASFEEPDYDQILPWISDEVEIWLTDWDEENPPTDLLP